MAQDVKLQERETELKLLLPNFRGGFYPEYLPADNKTFGDFIRSNYIVLRSRLRLPAFYWQIRWLFNPKDRKIYDINFILHVERDHDGRPDMWQEKLHYKIAKAHYRYEIEFVRALDEIGWQKEHIKDVYLQKDPYVKAYKKKWLSNFNEEPEWKLLYHGVPFYGLRGVLDKLDEVREKRLAYLNKHMDSSTENA